eukprot:scaffold19687_cov127-Skeletonema_dohrnii-CCMP3373.AAC.2
MAKVIFDVDTATFVSEPRWGHKECINLDTGHTLRQCIGDSSGMHPHLMSIDSECMNGKSCMREEGVRDSNNLPFFQAFERSINTYRHRCRLDG